MGGNPYYWAPHNEAEHRPKFIIPFLTSLDTLYVLK